MKKFCLPLVVLLTLWAGLSFAQVDTLRIASYNLLNFPGNDGASRLGYFRMVIRAIDPDILVVQELQSARGQTTFLNDVLNDLGREVYASGTFVDGPDTDNGIFFKVDKVSLTGSQQISTSLRDISEYTLESSAVEFRIYSVHLKASQGTVNENRRLDEADVLRKRLNNLADNENFIVAGDFNIYRASEPAFVRLTEEQAGNNSGLVDPLNVVGNWHNNSAFAAVHTQSTRTTAFGGGSTGGLDDRFDMMLVSTSLVEAGGMDVLAESYTAFGNDGHHFNLTINFGMNSSIPDSIADALLQASDHLPIFADFTFAFPTSVAAPGARPGPSVFELGQNYPNPFNPATTIAYTLNRAAHVTLTVYDLLGREIAVLVDDFQAAGGYRVEFKAEDLPGGVYVYRAQALGITKTRKLVLLR
ncbi:MAG: endonuclease/exonuclease/phosphatase family protein [bacterium]